jgi:hypothetical protein
MFTREMPTSERELSPVRVSTSRSTRPLSPDYRLRIPQPIKVLARLVIARSDRVPSWLGSFNGHLNNDQPQLRHVACRLDIIPSLTQLLSTALFTVFSGAFLACRSCGAKLPDSSYLPDSKLCCRTGTTELAKLRRMSSECNH